MLVDLATTVMNKITGWTTIFVCVCVCVLEGGRGDIKIILQVRVDSEKMLTEIIS